MASEKKVAPGRVVKLWECIWCDEGFPGSFLWYKHLYVDHHDDVINVLIGASLAER